MTKDELDNLEFKLEFGLPMAQSELNELQGKRALLREKIRRMLDLHFARLLDKNPDPPSASD